MQAVSAYVPLVDPKLGTLVNELGPAWKSRIAGFFLVLIFAGLPFLGGLADGNTPLMVGSVLAAVVALAAIQIVASGARVRVFEHGIERRGRFRTQRLAWSELRAYQLQILDTAVLAGAGAGLGGVLGVLIARGVLRALNKKRDVVPYAVVLFGVDGSKLSLTAQVKGYAELQKTLVPYLTDRLFPLAQQAFESGAVVSFGKKISVQRGAGITVKGLFGKPRVLPLELAASVTVTRAAVEIRRADTNAVWQTVAASQIENLGVLQRFVVTWGRRYDDGLPMAWTS